MFRGNFIENSERILLKEIYSICQIFEKFNSSKFENLTI